MASSGSYSWNPNTDSIIRGALRLLSAIQSGETPPADEWQDALDALNGMTKFWDSLGIHVWTELDATLFLQPLQYQYRIGTGSPDFCAVSNAWSETTLTANVAAAATTIAVASVSPAVTTGSTIVAGDILGIWLENNTTFWTTVTGVAGLVVSLASGLTGPALSGAYVVTYPGDQGMVRPLKVPAARRYQFAAPGGNAIEIPMMIMSRIDYASQPQKSVPGTPTQWFYDPQIQSGLPGQAASPNGFMNIWPAPSNNLSAIKFTAMRPIQDFSSQANTADLPQEWISTLRYNLAVELAAEYDCPPQRFQIIKAMADEKLEMSRSFDREPEPVLFGVAYDPTARV
jgi:hypothetical protein